MNLEDDTDGLLYQVKFSASHDKLASKAQIIYKSNMALSLVFDPLLKWTIQMQD